MLHRTLETYIVSPLTESYFGVQINYSPVLKAVSFYGGEVVTIRIEDNNGMYNVYIDGQLYTPVHLSLSTGFDWWRAEAHDKVTKHSDPFVAVARLYWQFKIEGRI